MVVSAGKFSLNVHPNLYLARLVGEDFKNRVNEITSQWTPDPTSDRWYDQYQVIYHQGQCIVVNSVYDEIEGPTIRVALGAPAEAD